MFKELVAVLFAASLFLVIPTANAAQSRHKPAKTVKVLPKGHHRVVVRGKPYFYSAGRFWRQNNGTYVTIAAPIGALIPALPAGHLSFGIGSRRHFYFQGVFYKQVTNGYEVVEKPPEAEDELLFGSNKLIIYPAAAQTDEQLSKDRYDCHVWASDETGYDPSNADSDQLLLGEYNRAMGACMEAKDYIVK